MSAASLADRIRHAIAPAHVAVEQTAFARGMTGGTLDRAGYCAGLRQLMFLHESVEAAFDAADHPAVQAVWSPERMARTRVAEADLAALGHPATPADEPAGLIGALYVLEGSKMGSMVLARSLGACLGVPRGTAGLDYHTQNMAGRPAGWQWFREAVAGLELTPAEEAAAVAGAAAVMDALVDLYAAVPARAPAEVAAA